MAETETRPAVGPETIEVRADERFDTDRVAEELRGRVEGSERALHVEQFGGGHANLTYLLRYGEGADAIEYVLRRPPLGPVAPGSHDMHREYRALSVLWQAFPVAPRAYHYCADESVIGAPFFVMERRHGIVVRGAIPEVYGGGADETANRKISQTVVDTLADFHRVDPKPIGLDALGRKPESFLERQVKGWADRYERSKVDASPIAEEVVAWLLDAMPRSPTPTLVHNDWKLDNMALDPADPGRCVAVYDWDMCSVGDPLCDVGTLLALWSDPGETTSAATPLPVDRPGFLGRQQVVERYAERSGLPASGIPYYDVFGTFKMGVVLQQIYFRYHQGQTKDARFAGLGAGAQSLYRLAGSRRP